MQSTIVFICLALASATTFTATEKPHCYLGNDGRTYVHYSSSHPEHQHFKCEHNSDNSACTCVDHPDAATHKTCKQFVHGGVTRTIGACEKSGILNEGTTTVRLYGGVGNRNVDSNTNSNNGAVTTGTNNVDMVYANHGDSYYIKKGNKCWRSKSAHSTYAKFEWTSVCDEYARFVPVQIEGGNGNQYLFIMADTNMCLIYPWQTTKYWTEIFKWGTSGVINESCSGWTDAQILTNGQAVLTMTVV